MSLSSTKNRKRGNSSERRIIRDSPHRRKISLRHAGISKSEAGIFHPTDGSGGMARTERVRAIFGPMSPAVGYVPIISQSGKKPSTIPAEAGRLAVYLLPRRPTHPPSICLRGQMPVIHPSSRWGGTDPHIETHLPSQLPPRRHHKRIFLSLLACLPNSSKFKFQISSLPYI